MVRLVIALVLSFPPAVCAQSGQANNENSENIQFQAGHGNGAFEIVLTTRSKATTLFCPLPKSSLNELLRGQPGVAKIYKENCEPLTKGRATLRYKVPREHWNQVLPVGVAAVPEALVVQIHPHLFFIVIEKNGKAREATQAEVDVAAQPAKAI